MVLPDFLHPKDKVALIAPAGAFPSDLLKILQMSIRRFELEPVIYPSCLLKRGYLAGTDEERAADVMQAFTDQNAKAVICIRGGYGSHRLMHLLDLDLIAASRKGLYGYSDISALHLEMNRRGVISWHTPMPGENWMCMDSLTEASLRTALFGTPSEQINFFNDSQPFGLNQVGLTRGYSEGILCGGNLTVLTSTFGTEYEIDTADKIIFLEDVDEAPYRIDRMLLQWRNAKKFEKCAGVIFGWFTNCISPSEKISLTLEEIFLDLLGDIGKPVLTGFMSGHSRPSISLPLGAKVSLDADNCRLKIIDM
jgi:muramoyltetrapeptide carboxypeptidase